MPAKLPRPSPPRQGAAPEGSDHGQPIFREAVWRPQPTREETSADALLRPWRLLDGRTYRARGERREIRAAAGRPRGRRAAHGRVQEDPPAGPRARTRPRWRTGPDREHRDPAVPRQALQTM